MYVSVIHTFIEMMVIVSLNRNLVISQYVIKQSQLQCLTSSTWAWVCCRRLLLDPALSGPGADLVRQ